MRLEFLSRLSGERASLVVQMEEEGYVIATYHVFVFFLDFSPKAGNEMSLIRKDIR